MIRWRHGLVCLFAAPVCAQQLDAAKPRWLIEPRVMTRFTMVNNGETPSQASSREAVIEVNPGIRIQANAPRAKGFLDYAVSGYAQIHGARDGSLRHQANGAGQLELVDQTFFVDVDGVISRQAVSAFGAQDLSDNRTSNQTSTVTGRLSPFVKGVLRQGVNYELRYTASGVLAEDSGRADSLSQAVSMSLGQSRVGRLGWSVGLEHQHVAYRGPQPDASFDTVNGALSYAITPQMQGDVTMGVESNNQLSLERESHRMVGLGMAWRPSEHTRFSARVTDRYFGVAHDLSFEQQAGRSVLRISDGRSIATQPGLETASLGNLYDLLDASMVGVESDPAARAKLVEDELRRRGLPGNLQVYRSFLTSRATVQRQQQLTWVYRGVRQSLSVGVNRSLVSRLRVTAGGLGDDLDTRSSVSSLAWNLALSHRLSPRSSITATYAHQRNSGGDGISEANAGSRSVAVSITSALGPRTAAGIQLRHTQASGVAVVPTETMLSGDLLHRF
jgi:uncharacterized protein (PEP-CTERM system associated)